MENKIIRYEDNAEEVDVTVHFSGKPINLKALVCKTCNRMYTESNLNMKGKDLEHIARYCCANDFPCRCGNRIDKKGWGYCSKCIEQKHIKEEIERFDKAELVEYDGPFIIDDDFYEDADEYICECEDNEIIPDEYAFVPEFVAAGIDPESIFDMILEDQYEGLELLGTEELKAAIEKFNEKNEKNGTYYEGRKKKFKIRK
jgi:hypothetical protein